MKKSQRLIIFTLLTISAVYSGAEVLMSIQGSGSSTSTMLLWTVVFAVLVALWVQTDAEFRHKEIPFEYSSFVFLFWPPVLAYYLVKTQGFRGCLKFLGFLALYLMPFGVGLLGRAFSG